MRFHCNSCNSDFTTLAERNSAKKFAFSHAMFDKMRCPHCGAGNSHTLASKPLRHTRNRWQPKRRSMDDYVPPTIVLHSLCQRRISGNIFSGDGLVVMCDGCPQFFNCYTGNVDDGTINKDGRELELERKEEQARKEAEAKVKLAEQKKQDFLRYLKLLRESLGKEGFSYREQNKVWYAKFGGTIWKLRDDDIMAIIRDAWDTPNTQVIKNSLTNKKITTTIARNLLVMERRVRLGA